MGNDYILTEDNELYHSGIKGMRWGIRRYQNKDGSLTDAGRKRYNAEAEDDKKSKDEKPKKKSAKDMTDEELGRAITRARMEDEYNRLRPEQPASKPKFKDRLIEETIKPAVINAGRNLLQNTIEKIGKDLLKDKADPNSVEALTKVRDKLKLTKEIEKLKNGPEEDTNWDNMLKKQTYERNKKKYDAEDAAAEAKAAADRTKAEAEARRHKQQNRDARDRATDNKRKGDAAEARRRNIQDEFEFDDTDSTVFTGTVEGTGNSRRKSSSGGETKTKRTTVIDAEWWEDVGDTSTTSLARTDSYSSGRSYISGYLDTPIVSLPAPRDDD